jgi:hypothetical protein
VKLSPIQKEVVDKLRNGWELGRATSGRGYHRVWMQTPGLGRGGESETIPTGTFFALYRKGVIEYVDDSGPGRSRRYALTEEWR